MNIDIPVNGNILIGKNYTYKLPIVSNVSRVKKLMSSKKEEK